MLEFVNFPLIRFKKSQLNPEYLKMIFGDKESEYNSWRESVLDLIDEQKYDEAQKLLGNARLMFFSFNLKNVLNDFTLEDCEIQNILSELERTKQYFPRKLKQFDISNNNNHITINLSNTTIDAFKLSYAYPNLKTFFPDIENKNRKGHCHEYVCKFINLDNNMGDDVKIATGYISPVINKEKYMHSWIEFKRGSNTWVIDPVLNLLINKKGYYFINNIHGKVYKISSDTILKEYDVLGYLISKNSWYSKLYFANRHQALALYKELMAKEKAEKDADPIYQAACTLARGFERYEKEKYSNKNKSCDNLFSK